MNDKNSIDELLSGFVDGELSADQTAEVQRLIANDPEVLERLNQLKKCKTLLNAMPCEQAPEDLLSQIKATLERQSLLNANDRSFDEQKGGRHLFARKLFTAAAMILLFSVLAVVVYLIISPNKITSLKEFVKQTQVPAKVEPEQLPKADTVDNLPAAIQDDTEKTSVFAADLELRAKTVQILLDAIKRAAEDNGVELTTENSSKSWQTVFALNCSRKNLGDFVIDIKDMWPQLESASLRLISSDSKETFVLESVTPSQLVEIAALDTYEEQNVLARDFAVVNSFETLVADNGTTEKEDIDLRSIDIPKPLLTTGERDKKTPADQDSLLDVKLKIIVESEMQ